MIYLFLFAALLLPFASHSLELIMELSEVSYITGENIFALLTKPYSIPVFLFLGFLLLLYVTSKLSSLICYCKLEGMQKSSLWKVVLSFGINRPFQVMNAKQFGLLFFAVPYYIFSNLPILIGIILYSDIEVMKGNSETLTKGLILILLIGISLLSLRGVFAYQYCLQENIGFKQALKYSRELLAGRIKRTLITYLTYTLFLTLGFILSYYLLLLLTSLGCYLFAAKNLAVTVFLSVYPRIRMYTTVLYGMAAFVLNINLTTSLFFTYRGEAVRTQFPSDPGFNYDFYYRSRTHKFSINGILICIILIGILNLYRSLYHDSSYFDEAFTGIQISSHRGNSFVAPENTIPALESAIAANSDYAEIDVRQTKDGTLVLMHDRSLKRTAGVSDFIWDLSDLEINALDVGTWFSLDYQNTRVPTLEEVLIYCKDRIKLNIEVKTNPTDIDTEKKLIELIKKYEYENQCVVSSTNYITLKKIKLLNKDIRTGYILSAVYGNFYDKAYIDFFSIRSNFINLKVVNSIHKAGKEVHAWTVNTPNELERMKSVGVDCIITDRPSLAREVLYRDDTNRSFIQLIYHMLNNRSFYRISRLLD
jgi:glycerophosphoryl diester phosphodiesterase